LASNSNDGPSIARHFCSPTNDTITRFDGFLFFLAWLIVNRNEENGKKISRGRMPLNSFKQYISLDCGRFDDHSRFCLFFLCCFLQLSQSRTYTRFDLFAHSHPG
jgi:hypothetical protein